MHFHSVTFDLDGTLLDTIADLAEACRLMLDEIGAPQRSPAEVHRFVGKGLAVLVERCLTHAQPPSVEQLNLAIVSFKRHYAAVNGRLTTIYPGVIAGLDAWKASGLRMGVVTNKPGMFTEALLEHMGLADYFDVVVSGDTTAHKKPHPEPILHACRILGVRPDRNLHIGDSKNDIHAAHAAGCQAYAVPYGYNEGEPVDSADCDALVSDLLAAYRQALTFKDLTKK
ncbi:phosphoglycolate phosphatase [Quatrionicoccus australiensis]|uniref:phosphoglycolate phosphatase n=1 Tax=Quatrionicoccus australiensis TaxID=138118 RepID=UPI001CF8B132|nr:phosphoglycolate phosphatase [Quatrionicoccus australiensis]UCV14586.1 phosphoglycolate phosphatase [Quatrionicoccus australiensis]